MGHMARTVLARISPFLWGAAVGFVIAYFVDQDDPVLAAVVILAFAAMAGTVCGAVEGTHDHLVEQLGQELAKATRQPGRSEVHLRQVR